MPTAIPETQLLQTVQKSIDNAFNQGIVGVLLLVGAGFFILAIVLLIYILRRPSQSADDSALLKIVSLNDLQFKAAAAETSSREKREADYQHERTIMSERTISAIDRQTTVIQSNNDTFAIAFETQKIDTRAIREGVNALNDLPLKDAIEGIKAILANVLIIKETLEHAEKRRQTGEIRAVIVPAIANPFSPSGAFNTEVKST